MYSKPQTNCQCNNYLERDTDMREGGHPCRRQTICLSDSTYLCDTTRQQRTVRLASMKGSMCSIRAWVLLMMNWLTHAMAWDLQHNNHQLQPTQAFYPHMLHAMKAAPVFFLALFCHWVDLQLWGTLVFFCQWACCFMTGWYFICTIIAEKS